MRNLIVFVAILLIGVLLFLGSNDSIRATTISPTYTVALSNTASSANSDITVTYDLGSLHSLYSARISFMPPEFTVAADIDVPDGARVGKYIITSTHSQSNAACSSGSVLAYDLLEASTNTANVVADSPRIPSPTWPGFTDANFNSLPDAVDKYPNFLNTLYPGLTPRARAFGFDTLDPTYFRAVNILIFDPGTVLPGLSPLDASLGYIVVAVQQDPTAPAVASSVDTDACSALGLTHVQYGISRDNLSTSSVNESGFVNRANPSSDGTYTFMDYSRTIRDSDNDGIENTLDSCPSDTDTWTPRSVDPIEDFDADGIPATCDPFSITTNDDEDSDTFLNRQDNCPLTANVGQADSDGDGIGDACDPFPSIPTGHLHEICVSQNVDIGLAGTPPSLTCPDLITDEDNDGYSDTAEAWVGTDPHLPCGNGGWPSDLFTAPPSDNKITLQDIGSFIAPVPYFGTNIGTNPGDVRWDIVPGAGPFLADINIQDLGALIGGSTGAPPMLGNQTAFNGSDCPYP